MNRQVKDYLNECLYFTANSLSRSISKMAEEEFKPLGIAPSHAFLLMLVFESPGSNQKDLAQHLHLAQSTVSRFINALVKKKLVKKKSEGKTAVVFATAEGEKLVEAIHESWKNLHERYSNVLGQHSSSFLTKMAADACAKLETDL